MLESTSSGIPPTERSVSPPRPRRNPCSAGVSSRRSGLTSTGLLPLRPQLQHLGQQHLEAKAPASASSCRGQSTRERAVHGLRHDGDER
jgi:hypothetical protein